MKKILNLLLVFIILFSTACNKEGVAPENADKSKLPNYLGKINYSASDYWIEPSTTDEGDMLYYREVLNMDEFLTYTKLPVILCVKKSQDRVISKVIPQMEEWAYKYRGKANFVLLEDNRENNFLNRLNYTVTPTYYLISDGTVIAYASWQEENALKILKEKFLGLIAS